MTRVRNLLSLPARFYLYVAAGGGAAALIWWQCTHRSLLAGLVFANQLPPEMRNRLILLELTGVASAMAAWIALGLIAALRGRDALLWMKRGAALALLSVPAATVPLLGIAQVETDSPLLAFSLIALLGLLAYAAVSELLRYFCSPAADGRFLGTRAGLAAVVLMMVGYGAYMSALTIARHNAFMTHSFDLGIHDQVFYNILHTGLMRSSQYGEQTLFYDHLSPLLYLIAPLYAVNPDARTLLVLQSIALAAGALPVFLLGRRSRSTIFAVVLSASYLLQPALHGVNTFDFHQIALATPLLLTGLYLLDKGRLAPAVICLLFAMGAKEDISLSVAAVGGYLVIRGPQSRPKLGLALIAAGLAYFALAVLVIMPAMDLVPHSHRFEELIAPGSSGFVGVAKTLVTNPYFVWTYMVGNPDKLIYLCQLLLPVLFMPLLAGRAWITALAAAAVALLSSSPVQYSITTQYSAHLLPFIYFLAATGFRKLNTARWNRAALAAGVLAASLGASYIYGSIFGRSATGIPQPSAHDRIVATFVADIPPEASVSTLGDIVPHLSSRSQIYLFPSIAGAEYILFDAHPGANLWPLIERDPRAQATDLLAPRLISGEYGLVRAEDGCLLLKRGHDPAQNAAALAALYSDRVEAEDLLSDFPGSVAPDPQASGGRVRLADPSLSAAEGKEALMFGPHAALPAGRYRLSYALGFTGAGSEQIVAELDVFSNAAGGPLAQRRVTAAEFLPEPNQEAAAGFQIFTLEVETANPLPDAEYRLLYRGTGQVAVDYVEIAPLYVVLPVAAYEMEDMPGEGGANVPDAAASAGTARAVVSSRQAAQAPAPLVYGPYTHLMAGRYRATFALRYMEQNAAGTVATAEVYSGRTGGRIAAVDIAASEFSDSAQYQQFIVEFSAAGLIDDAEFRVLYHGPGELRADFVKVALISQTP